MTSLTETSFGETSLNGTNVARRRRRRRTVAKSEKPFTVDANSAALIGSDN